MEKLFGVLKSFSPLELKAPELFESFSGNQFIENIKEFIVRSETQLEYL